MIGIDLFLRRYQRKNTRIGYEVSLKDFFNYLGTSPEAYSRNKRIEYECDITGFIVYLKEKKKLSSKSIEAKLGAVRSYFSANEIDIPRNFWKLNRINAVPLTCDRVPTKEELQSIFTHMNAKGRAFFMMQLSSGCRIGDLLEVSLESICLDKKRFHYHIQKIDKDHVGFLTDEAVIALTEWLRIRPAYFASLQKRAQERGNVIKDDGKLFPFSKFVAYDMWHDALKKSGLGQKDTRTYRLLIHPHCLRKYVRTHGGTILSENSIEAIIGHSGGLYGYDRLGDMEEKLFSEFQRIEHLLTVFTKEISNPELTNRIEMLETEIRSLKQERDQIFDQWVESDTKLALASAPTYDQVITRKDGTTFTISQYV